MPIRRALPLLACRSSSPPRARRQRRTGEVHLGVVVHRGRRHRGARVSTSTLVDSLTRGIGSIRTARFTVRSQLVGQSVTGSGDEVLAGGRLTGLSATATLPGSLGDVALVVTGGRTFAKLPKALSSSPKPWTAITADSSNPVVAQLASFVDTALTAASLDNLAHVAGAASSVRDLGAATVGGVAATHFRVQVDPTRLPSSLAGKAGLGTASIPAEIWVDAKGRPVQVRVALKVSGSATDTTIGFSRFDAPVTVTAPPASQVATG